MAGRIQLSVLFLFIFYPYPIAQSLSFMIISFFYCLFNFCNCPYQRTLIIIKNIIMEFSLLFTHISFFLLSINDLYYEYRKYFEISCFYLILFCVLIEYFFTILEVLISLITLLYNCCKKENQDSKSKLPKKESSDPTKKLNYLTKNKKETKNYKNSKNDNSKDPEANNKRKVNEKGSIIFLRKNPISRKEECKASDDLSQTNSRFSIGIPNKNSQEKNSNLGKFNQNFEEIKQGNYSSAYSKNQKNSLLNSIPENINEYQLNTNLIGYYVNHQPKANYINYNYVQNDYTGKFSEGNSLVNNSQAFYSNENPNTILLPGQIRSSNNSTTQVIGLDNHHNLGNLMKNDSSKNGGNELINGNNYYRGLFRVLK